jgi:hypothetical protein
MVASVGDFIARSRQLADAIASLALLEVGKSGR